MAMQRPTSASLVLVMLLSCSHPCPTNRPHAYNFDAAKGGKAPRVVYSFGEAKGANSSGAAALPGGNQADEQQQRWAVAVQGAGARADAVLGTSHHRVQVISVDPAKEGSKPSDISYTRHQGYISGGDDLLTESMTVEEAKIKCATLDGCKGFTFEGDAAHGATVLVYFKKKWDVNGNGWTAYKLEAAVQESASNTTSVSSSLKIETSVTGQASLEHLPLRTPEGARGRGPRGGPPPRSFGESIAGAGTTGQGNAADQQVIKQIVEAEHPEAGSKPINKNDLMRLSVVRIQSVVQNVDWFRPYRPGPDQQSVGSGFAVHSMEEDHMDTSAEDPIFVTNAHVVRDAHTVQIQLPTISQQKFDAYVPLIYSAFDLALVKLKDPAKFLKFLAEANKKLTILHVDPPGDNQVTMGLNVAAYGFPLGSLSLKLSEGVIAGTEVVNGAICYQSTAPISPGNSGGPLFAISQTDLNNGDEPRLIGVNFATASDNAAQNANYVVPSVFIHQALHAYMSPQVASPDHSMGPLKEQLEMVDKTRDGDEVGPDKVKLLEGQAGIQEADGHALGGGAPGPLAQEGEQKHAAQGEVSKEGVVSIPLESSSSGSHMPGLQLKTAAGVVSIPLESSSSGSHMPGLQLTTAHHRVSNPPELAEKLKPTEGQQAVLPEDLSIPEFLSKLSREQMAALATQSMRLFDAASQSQKRRLHTQTASTPSLSEKETITDPIHTQFDEIFANKSVDKSLVKEEATSALATVSREMRRAPAPSLPASPTPGASAIQLTQRGPATTDQITNQQDATRIRDPGEATLRNDASESMVKAGRQKQKIAHVELRVAPLEAVGVETNDAMYKSSGGCSSGFYLSKVQNQSALHHAVPPVPEHAYITTIDGVKLDSFGMGVTNGFLEDPLRFENIMSLHNHIEDDVQVSVCKSGTITEHKVSMTWRPEYEKGIRTITEHYFHREALDYEVFADVTVMEMTLNHVKAMLDTAPPSFGRWMMPENQVSKRLMVTDVIPGTYASRVMMKGMVLQTLNGRNVTTLEEFRRFFVPAADGNPAGVWSLETDRGVKYVVGFQKSLEAQVAFAAQMPDYAYVLTPFIHAAAKQKGNAETSQTSGHGDGQDIPDSFLARS